MSESTSKKVIRDLTPPAFLRLALRSRTARPGGRTREAGPEFYDGTFESKDHWRVHYSLSPWYYIWTVLGDRLGATGDPSILDVGCGSGQIAQMLNDMGFTKYVGFDFSPKRIEWARQEVPTYRFELADAYETTLFADTEYDSVVCTEFLEHVEGDLAVLDRVRPGTRFLGTVPDFGGGSHVRFFRSAGEVEDRYAEQFSPFQVSTFVRPGGTSRQFLIDGVKN